MNINLKNIVQEILKNRESIQEKFSSIEIEGMSITSFMRKKIKEVNEYMINSNKDPNNVIHYKSIDLIFEYVTNIRENLSFENLEEKLQDSNEFLKIFIKYLDSDNDENLDEIIEVISKWIISSNYGENLSSNIGESTFSKAVTMVVTHSVKMNKVLYHFAIGKIDKIKANAKLLALNNVYTLQIANFIKNEVSLQEFIPEILDLLQGKKSKAILNTIIKVTIKILKSKGINKSVSEIISEQQNERYTSETRNVGKKYEERNNN